MPDLPAILEATRPKPDDERHWLALTPWQWDDGLDDEAAVMRVFRPTLREEMASESKRSALQGEADKLHVRSRPRVALQ
jgi:hypothetical protein